MALINDDKILEKFVRMVRSNYKQADGRRWVAASAASYIVGNYADYATSGMADSMNVSKDTVEDLAHAYNLYLDLLKFDHRYVAMARRMDGMYISHFRALYDLRQRYMFRGRKHEDIPLQEIISFNEEIMDLFVDIVQSIQNGDPISSRGIEKHAIERYGMKKPWNYYGNKAATALHQALECQDLSPKKRKALKRMYKLIAAWAK